MSENGGFCCLVHTTTGGMSPECEAFDKQLAHMLADRRKDDYSVVANYIRTKIIFALLKSVIIRNRRVIFYCELWAWDKIIIDYYVRRVLDNG